MTCIAVRIRSSDTAEAAAALTAVLVSRSEVVTNERSPLVARVAIRHSIATLRDAIKPLLIAAVWYEISTHVCFHDQQPTQPCLPWEVRATRGTVPPEGVE